MVFERIGGEKQATGRTALQIAALAVGAVFLLVGVLGFVPGITTNYDQLSFAVHISEAQLLGLFQVSVLHNIVHLPFGVVGVALARTRSGSYWFLLWSGIIYAVLFVFGLIVPHDSAANFVPVNAADNWLRLGLAVGMTVLVLILAPKRNTTAT
ncbi:DUF4383 domain-containing protein [Arthrobacter sp. Sr33]